MLNSPLNIVTHWYAQTSMFTTLQSYKIRNRLVKMQKKTIFRQKHQIHTFSLQITGVHASLPIEP